MYVQEITVKKESRVFFVSDLHGELYTLLHGLKELGFKEGVDVCISAGDLIDRGRYSLETAMHFLNDTTNSYYSVLGNHDVFAFDDTQYRDWMYNGGDWIHNYSKEVIDDLANKIEALPFIIDLKYHDKRFGISHANLPNDIKDFNEAVEIMQTGNPSLCYEITWNRDAIYNFFRVNYEPVPIANVDYMIHGHTPIKQHTFVSNMLFIDTGIAYGKQLTIAEYNIHTEEFEFYKFDKVDKK